MPRSDHGVPIDLHIVFVTDCTAHQKWMAFNVFNSARAVGQEDPITWVRSGCTEQQNSKDNSLAQSLYPKAAVRSVGGDDGKGEHDFNLAFGVPKAVQGFVKTAEGMSNSSVLALIEADFVFLSKLRLDDLTTRGLPMNRDSLIEVNGLHVGGKVGVAQHYQCCDNLGPPYILSVESWRELAPLWVARSAAHTDGGWGGDQQGFAEAASGAGLSFNIFDHFMVSDSESAGEGWSLIEEVISSENGDVCATKKVGLQPGIDRVPTFMHIVRPWTAHYKKGYMRSELIEGTAAVQNWGFSKYQVPPGWRVPQTSDGILECGMPLFAEPPSTLLSKGESPKDSWAICTIIHSLNSMLTQYKKATCPAGFNDAKGLKMNVPLDWSNKLLPGSVEAAPAGTDLKWLKDCVEKPRC